MAELVAQGGPGSLSSIGAYEDRFVEGDEAQLNITMRFIPVGTVSLLQRALDLGKVPVTVTGAPGGLLVLRGRKGLAFLALLALVLGVFFVGAILLLVTAWALFRNAGIAALGGIGLLALAAVALFALGTSRRRRAAT